MKLQALACTQETYDDFGNEAFGIPEDHRIADGELMAVCVVDDRCPVLKRGWGSYSGKLVAIAVAIREEGNNRWLSFKTVFNFENPIEATVNDNAVVTFDAPDEAAPLLAFYSLF